LYAQALQAASVAGGRQEHVQELLVRLNFNDFY
jgi:hypothetical protein